MSLLPQAKPRTAHALLPRDLLQTSRLVVVSTLAFTLAACGGGGGDGTSTAAKSTAVTGTAAFGKPLAGVQVVAIDTKTGQTCGQTTTQADGTYKLSTGTCGQGDTLLFEVVGGTPNGSPLESMSIPNPGQTVSGTINITPLTTFYLYTALASISLDITTTSQSAPPPDVLQAMSSSGFSTTYQMAVSKIDNSLTQVLSKYGINGATFDSVTQPFVANGTGIDSFFDDYPLTVPNAESIALGSSGNYLLQLGFPTTSGTTYTLSGTAVTSPSGGAASGTGTSSSSSGASGQNDATSCFNPHYLQNGNTIDLIYSTTDSQGNNSTLTENHSITGPVTWNGQSAWRDDETGGAGNGSTTTNYLVNHDNQTGIYSIALGSYTTNYSPYYNFIDYTTRDGQTYTYNIAYTSDGNPVPLTQTVTTTFNGLKAVQVPAGNFNVCEFTSDYSYDNSALSAENYQIVQDIAAGSGVAVRTATTTVQGTTTQSLMSATINGIAITP